jgi:hypothetical protein
MDIASPAREPFRVEQRGNELLLRRRTESPGQGLFLALWLTGWTFGCVFLVRQAIREPSIFHLLFALPFCSAWLFASYGLLQSFLGFEQLKIGPEGLEHRALFTRRFVPLDEVMGITKALKTVPGGRGRKETTQPFARIILAGKPMELGPGAGDDELKRLSDLIHDHLQALVPKRNVLLQPKAAVGASPRIEVLSPDGAEVKRPSESSIEQVVGWDETTFRRRGRVGFVDLASSALICLFWNGILGVFVVQTFPRFWWSS